MRVTNLATASLLILLVAVGPAPHILEAASTPATQFCAGRPEDFSVEVRQTEGLTMESTGSFFGIPVGLRLFNSGNCIRSLFRVRVTAQSQDGTVYQLPAIDDMYRYQGCPQTEGGSLWAPTINEPQRVWYHCDLHSFSPQRDRPGGHLPGGGLFDITQVEFDWPDGNWRQIWP
jgi:hypothetical protein